MSNPLPSEFSDRMGESCKVTSPFFGLKPPKTIHNTKKHYQSHLKLVSRRHKKSYELKPVKTKVTNHKKKQNTNKRTFIVSKKKKMFGGPSRLVFASRFGLLERTHQDASGEKSHLDALFVRPASVSLNALRWCRCIYGFKWFLFFRLARFLFFVFFCFCLVIKKVLCLFGGFLFSVLERVADSIDWFSVDVSLLSNQQMEKFRGDFVVLGRFSLCFYFCLVVKRKSPGGFSKLPLKRSA